MKNAKNGLTSKAGHLKRIREIPDEFLAVMHGNAISKFSQQAMYCLEGKVTCKGGLNRILKNNKSEGLTGKLVSKYNFLLSFLKISAQ